jgi:hypothetical protein
VRRLQGHKASGDPTGRRKCLREDWTPAILLPDSRREHVVRG